LPQPYAVSQLVLLYPEERPVPPLTTERVPPRVIVPELVIGLPEVVSPVVPPDTATDVTVPEPPPPPIPRDDVAVRV
jgi:hypothetical protein